LDYSRSVFAVVCPLVPQMALLPVVSRLSPFFDDINKQTAAFQNLQSIYYIDYQSCLKPVW